MQIISYNVNGIRAALKKGFAEWLQQQNPDIICLQETKAHINDIPTEIFTDLGYHCHWHSAHKKGYSGVGILSKQAPDQVTIGCGIPQYDHEGRVLRADFGNLSVLSVYMPSGSSGEDRQNFKMQFLADFRPFIEQLLQQRPQLIIAGDCNIAHQAIDIHDPIRNANASGFLPEEREWLSDFLTLGITDTFRHQYPQQKDHYSWWSFRANARQNNKGWRIDYICASLPIAQTIQDAGIYPHIQHSDHCPIWVDIAPISVSS